jgi:hypothetical protein
MREIKKYRKKPVVIEAVRYMCDMPTMLKLANFMGGGVTTDHLNRVEIETLEGIMYANPGDYIIKGIKGEFYPCKPDIFEATYEEAEHAGD